MEYTIGIDPGKSGAIVVINDKGKLINVFDCPIIKGKKKGKKNKYDEREMAGIIERLCDECKKILITNSVWIESVHAFPGQGVCSMFNFGYGFGVWIGILSALKLSYNLVAPQTWKKVMLKDMPKSKDKKEGKQNSVIVAKRLFPEAEQFLTLKKHHDRADAILIAMYGRIRNAQYDISKDSKEPVWKITKGK